MGTASAFLEPIHSPVVRKKIAVFDVESKANPHPVKDPDGQLPGFTRVFQVGWYDGNAYRAFFADPKLDSDQTGSAVDQFCRWLFLGRGVNRCKLKRPDYRDHNIYAHNGGNFDFLFLLPWLAKHSRELKFEIIPVQTSIQILEVRKKITKGKRRGEIDKKSPPWRFLDSIRLLPLGLDRAGNTFGVGGKLKFDLRTPWQDKKAWTEYNRVDCEKLYKVVEKASDLIIDTLGGEVGVTLPASAMKLYRRKYLGQDGCPRKIPRHKHWAHDCPEKVAARNGDTPVNCDGCLHPFIRQAYYGGRTEIFKLKGKNLHYFDLNSSYPAAMLEDMPAGEKIEDFGKVDQHLLRGYIGFVECTVYIPPSCQIPPLPYRDPISGKLIFPNGSFTGVWSTTELALLAHPLVGGKIEAVGKVVWYGRRRIFDGFVRDLYKYRDKSLPGYDEGLAALAKLFLNAGYGKFGMNEERTQVHYLADGEIPPTGATPAGGNADGRVWYSKKIVSPSYVLPQIAAEITTQARCRLWKHMAEVIEAGEELYYVDTDSLITSAVLPSDTALGALKDEYPGETLDFEGVQPKVYILTKGTSFEKTPATKDGWLVPEVEKETDTETGEERELHRKVAMKGVPGSVREHAYEMLRLMQGDVQLMYPRLEKFRSMARRDYKGGPRTVEVKKGIRSVYDKRVVQADGSTWPIFLNVGPPESLDSAAE